MSTGDSAAVPAPPSPCVNRCELDVSQRLCLGCARTVDEIMAWRTLDAAAQWQVVRAAAARRATVACDVARHGAARQVAQLLLVACALGCAPRGAPPAGAPPVAPPSRSTASGAATAVPAALLGTFEDDYGSRYQVTTERFVHQPKSVYHIVEWNVSERYFLARNAAENPSDGGTFARVDWVAFTDQGPFSWGYCFSAYREPTLEAARAAPPADRAAPRAGCNGFPFSRMRRIPEG